MPSGLRGLKESVQPGLRPSEGEKGCDDVDLGLQQAWEPGWLWNAGSDGIGNREESSSPAPSRPKAHCACARPVGFAANLRGDFATRGALRAHLRQRRSCGCACVTGCPGNRRSCRCLVASETQVFVMQLKHLRTLLSPQVRSCVPVPPRPVLTFPRSGDESVILSRAYCVQRTDGGTPLGCVDAVQSARCSANPCRWHCVSFSVRFVPGPVLGLGGIQS